MMTQDLLKDGYDYEDYTENYVVEKKTCCKDKKPGESGSGCGCGKGGIPIKK
ncbi:hypothetical protein [Proteiniclasticum sp.]|uniref:hypothetical protein n=1 Tax=Proteiniclasticum sp. TaxID=2053595 RepID=UPI0028A2ABFF|nr:hypothetical protein [Proteiniclasticum sp.]